MNLTSLGPVERIQNSYQYGLNEQRARELAGLQPTLPYTDLDFIVKSNLFYFTMTYFLYSYMQRQEKGFDLKGVIFYYNVLCVFLAGAVVVGILSHWARYGLHSFVCNPEDRGEKGHELAYVFYLFYAQKFIEWADTWFFILRRSFRQVSFLHIFHHSSITVVVGMILPMAFSGDMYLPILANAVVHCIMYSYYALTSMGYRFWWKKIPHKPATDPVCADFFPKPYCLASWTVLRGSRLWQSAFGCLHGFNALLVWPVFCSVIPWWWWWW
jgi:elongation of very long chain fatty acids protein 4